MGEIKSTFDIILERIKNMKITEEEILEIEESEREKEAKSLFNRIKNGMIVGKFIGEEISKKDERVRKKFANILIENLTISDNDFLFEAARHIFKDEKELLEELLGVREKFLKEVREEIVRRKKALKEELNKYGMFGDAIVPNVEKRKDFREKASKIKDKFLGAFLDVKERIKRKMEVK